jgi:spermidine/putrescine transport system ATP-binding protein
MRKTPKDEINRRVADALRLVQLEGYEQRRSNQLSGGQQQRIALARALVNSPKVLLLDEPLGALDLKLRQQMQIELKQLQREVGITFVFVTHDQEEALTMSDRIGVMDQGQLLQVGTPEEIYEHPVNRFVADFIGRTNLLDGTVESPETVCLHNGTRIHAASDLETGTPVAVSLRPERASVAPAGTEIGERPSLGGQLRQMTYLGNALVYTIGLDWMELEVRTENTAEHARLDVGDDVIVSWQPGAVSVVVD